MSRAPQAIAFAIYGAWASFGMLSQHQEGLRPGRAYYWKVIAEDGKGGSRKRNPALRHAALAKLSAVHLVLSDAMASRIVFSGVKWHTHWVVLTKDSRVPGGLSVKEFKKADGVVLPPTNPGMDLFMDSPGYAVSTRGRALRVVVPADRIKNATQFNYDAVTCYMQVSAPKGGQRDTTSRCSACMRCSRCSPET